MSVQISLKNFQSWSELSIEVDGFTVIVGESNIGKSAIVRAIDAIMDGSFKPSYIKDGSSECVIQLTSGEHIFSYRKSDSKNVITIDGEVYEKVGKKGVNQLVDSPFFKNIKVVSEKEINLHLSNQYDLLPVLSLSANDLASYLLTFFNLMEFLNLYARLKDWLLEHNRKLKELNEKLKKLQLNLEIVKSVENNLIYIENNLKFLNEKQMSLFMLYEQVKQLPNTNKRLSLISHITTLNLPSEVFKFPPDSLKTIKPLIFNKTIVLDFKLLKLAAFKLPSTINMPSYESLDILMMFFIKCFVKKQLHIVNTDRFSNLLELLKMLKYTEVIKHIKEIEEQLKICPFCRRPFNANTK